MDEYPGRQLHCGDKWTSPDTRQHPRASTSHCIAMPNTALPCSFYRVPLLCSPGPMPVGLGDRIRIPFPWTIIRQLCTEKLFLSDSPRARRGLMLCNSRFLYDSTFPTASSPSLFKLLFCLILWTAMYKYIEGLFALRHCHLWLWGSFSFIVHSHFCPYTT